MNANSQNRPKSKKKRNVIIILIVLGVLLIIRLMLPSLLLNTVNKKLSTMEGFTGYVNDIDINFYRGAYAVNGIHLQKITKKKNDTIPFFDCKAISLAIDWKMIFKGVLVSRITVDQPVLSFMIKEKIEKEDIEKAKDETPDFNEILADFMPLRINTLEIRNGEVHYVDLKKKPVIDLTIKNIEVLVNNLSNIIDKDTLLPARMQVGAEIYEGKFSMDVRFNILKEHPTFDMKMELEKMNMVKLNEFFREYGNFDIQKGSFSLYSEVAGRNGEFGGYLKPFIEEFKVKKYKDKEDFKEIAWEAILGSTMKILENRKTDEVATKVPIKGKFDQPDINLWRAISLVLRNAFVNALQPVLDNSININKLEEKDKTFLEKIFRKDK